MKVDYRNSQGFYLFIVLLAWCILASEATNNTITLGQLIRDGQTIISANQNFALGFFSPANSTLRYVGTWYNKIPLQTVVWVANRNNPISDESGVLSFGNDGNLKILDGNSSVLWSTSISSAVTNTTAILTDIGDLIILRSEDINDLSEWLWKGFSHPTDTYLPDIRAYFNFRTGEGRVFPCWKSANDPSIGNYSMGIDSRGSPQIVIMENSHRRWRSGHWTGLVFAGVPSMRALYLYGFKLTNEGNGRAYFTYSMVNVSDIMRFRIRWDGFIEQLFWNVVRREWNVTVLLPSTECDLYNKCGNFGLCRVGGFPICTCIDGFEPRSVDEWNNGNWSGGCIRRTSLQCEMNGTSDGFLEVQGVKLPDYADNTGAVNADLCEEECLRNCSCNAYTYLHGIGCMVWNGDLVDVEHFVEGGNTLYIHLPNTELGGERRISKEAVITIGVVIPFFLGVSMWILWWFRVKVKALSKSLRSDKQLICDMSESQDFEKDFLTQDELFVEGNQGNGPQSPLVNFNIVEIATENFADKNKLGEGGFGPVYKGTLPGGLEIAVKRLSKCSGQGLDEFKTEILLIAKLQHRNLVRLLGCCIKEEEKLLIYEYMPNNSLDSFLFDAAMKVQLDWSKRFTIIIGIARGLLYLHRDSRLRIIHRDLKASNILLDEEMNPKISDFGTARIFGGNQNEGNTARIIGTYGYMSPEYAMEGLFSIKSDVYSFGVLLLEIVSGLQNIRSSERPNLIRYAWDLWNDGRAMELVDSSIADSCSRNEVLQCIHVGMLCVQVSTVHRPTMPNVMQMLESEQASLPMPREPHITSINSPDLFAFTEGYDMISSSALTITEETGR